MKRYSILCIALCFALLGTVGCGKNKAENADAAPFFMLKELPETVMPEETGKYARISAAYSDTLAPSDSYGTLLPFAGEYYFYKSADEGSDAGFYAPVYGLCKTDGTVVVDPVYDAVIRHDDGDTFIYELVTGAVSGGGTFGKRLLAAGDGSWVFEIPSTSKLVSISGGRILLERTRTVRKQTTIYHDFYEYGGRKVFTFDTTAAEDENISYTIGNFADGYAPVHMTKHDPETKEDTQSFYYIDLSGAAVFGNFTYCGEFHGGYAIVADENGRYGVINTKGEYFLKPSYRAVNYNAEKGYFACGAEGEFLIINQNGETVKRIYCDRGNIEILHSEPLIYKKTNSSTGRSEYFYFDSDQPFICTSTGQFPDSGDAVGGLFVCSYGGTSNIFDESGESIVSLTDFGRLAVRYGDMAVAVNADGAKSCFLYLNTGKTSGWLDMTFTRQVLADRYLVFKNAGGYSLYDITSEQYVYENCEYIEARNGTLTVITYDTVAVFDGELNPLLQISGRTLY